jgi:GT2 family glycosyltransferase
MNSRVCITIVTYNSDTFIASCLESVFAQTEQDFEVVVVDNASTDHTRQILHRNRKRLRILYNDDNLGFAAAQNQAIRASKSDWVLVLNPDVILKPDFLERLLAVGRSDREVGTVCGRLMALGRDLKPIEAPLIDTAGIYFTPSLRHLDRGWRQPDTGQYRQREYVFGASAAAALYRRDMIVDVSEEGDFFDPDFFSYREDADVAWRAQLLGWHCLYVPDAVGHHVRSVGPDNRRRVPAVLNMHSVKNRILMRVKNMTGGIYRKFWLPATMRDLLVLGGCLLWEQRSLPAFWYAAKCLPRALKQRKSIMSRRRVSDETLAHWFNVEPSAEPARRDLNPVTAPVLAAERSRP